MNNETRSNQIKEELKIEEDLEDCSFYKKTVWAKLNIFL